MDEYIMLNIKYTKGDSYASKLIILESDNVIIRIQNGCTESEEDIIKSILNDVALDIIKNCYNKSFKVTGHIKFRFDSSNGVANPVLTMNNTKESLQVIYILDDQYESILNKYVIKNNFLYNTKV